MSLQLIIDATRKLNVSKPIFKLEIDSSGYRGTSIGLGEHLPSAKVVNSPTTNDIFEKFALKHFRETYNAETKTFKLERETIEKLIYKDVQAYLKQFIDNTLGKKSKNFDTSKLGKWYYRFALNADKSIPTNGLGDNLVSLFKYLKDNEINGFLTMDEKHINNGIAVIKAICDKYYNEDDTRMRRRRRRRR